MSSASVLSRNKTHNETPTQNVKTFTDPKSSGNVFGEALAEAVQKQKVKEQIKDLVLRGMLLQELIEAVGLPEDEVLRIAKQLKLSVATEAATPDKKPAEMSLSEFMQTATDDLDLVSWHSYYTLLRFSEPLLSQTEHVKDSMGVLLEHKHVNKLIREAFQKLYPKGVLEFLCENRIDVVAIHTKKLDTTTLMGKKVRIRHIHLEIRESAFRDVIALHHDLVDYLSEQATKP